MYKIEFSEQFAKKVRFFTEKDVSLKNRIKKTLLFISEKPNYPSLKTHKVVTSKYGECFSSSVTGDLRIIWDYKIEKLSILALDFCGHSGKHSVYK